MKVFDTFEDVIQDQTGGVLTGRAVPLVRPRLGLEALDDSFHELQMDGLSVEICCQRCGRPQIITFAWEELAEFVASPVAQASEEGWREPLNVHHRQDAGEDDWWRYVWRCQKTIWMPDSSTMQVEYLDPPSFDGDPMGRPPFGLSGASRYVVEYPHRKPEQCGGSCSVTLGLNEMRNMLRRADEKGWWKDKASPQPQPQPSQPRKRRSGRRRARGR